MLRFIASTRKNLNWYLLSTYRIELFGIAVLGVLLVHSIPSSVTFSSSFVKVLSFGQNGVNMFLFLSGIGLYFSLKNNNSLTHYYKKRMLRVLIPYLIISGIFYCWIDILVDHNLIRFFSDLSLLSFWTEHRGAWYVAMIIPIYLVFPVFFRLVEKSKSRLIAITFSAIIAVFASIVIYNLNIDLFKSLTNIFIGIPVFLAGYYFGKLVMEKKDISIYVILFCTLCLIIKNLIPFSNDIRTIVGEYGYALGFAIALCILCPLLLDSKFFKRGFVNKFLRFLGTMSLEIYLTNIYLRYIFYFKFNVINYLLIILFGIIISLFFNKLIGAFFEKKQRKPENNPIITN